MGLATDSINYDELEMTFTVTQCNGCQLELVDSGAFKRVTAANVQEYLGLAEHALLMQFDEQVAQIRAGLARVLGVVCRASF